MSTLMAAAKEEIRAAGLTLAAYAHSIGWDDGRWYGDACGCSDDRCAGYHHDEHDACGCLPVLIDRALTERAQGRNLSDPLTVVSDYD